MPELPDWFRDVAEYMLREGLPETLRLAAISVTASLVVGLLLGTLITLRFRPLQWLIRFYIEVWRGLPILVTVLFIYWLPAYHRRRHRDPAERLHVGGRCALAVGQRAGGRGDPRGGAVDSARSSTRRPRRSASAGSAGTGPWSCPRRCAGSCRRWSGCS